MWVGHVARTGAVRNAYKILIEICVGKEPFERHKRRW